MPSPFLYHCLLPGETEVAAVYPGDDGLEVRRAVHRLRRAGGRVTADAAAAARIAGEGGAVRGALPGRTLAPLLYYRHPGPAVLVQTGEHHPRPGEAGWRGETPDD